MVDQTWMSIEEACEVLNVVPRTLRKYASKGIVERRKEGRRRFYRIVEPPTPAPSKQIAELESIIEVQTQTIDALVQRIRTQAVLLAMFETPSVPTRGWA